MAAVGTWEAGGERLGLDLEEYLTAQQAADELSINERTIRNWIKRGQLRHDRTPGGRIRIRRRWLHEAMEHVEPID